MKSLAVFVSIVFWISQSDAGTAVKYGGEPELDACSALGQVANLLESGDGFLAVRQAPSVKAKRLDKLVNGQTLWICEEVENWFGIVYDKSGKLDCGVSTPVNKRKPYSGPCRSGWVSKKFVTPIAG